VKDMTRLSLIFFLLVATVAAVSAGAGAADIGIVSVTPSSARPGEVVRVHVNGYLPMHEASMPVVLVADERMPRPYPCKNNQAICEPIALRARLRRAPYRLVGFAGNWTRSQNQPDHVDSVLRVRVPAIAAGRYRFALWCGPCVRGPQGSLIAGPLLVVRAEK